jgi:hypothetical protein
MVIDDEYRHISSHPFDSGKTLGVYENCPFDFCSRQVFNAKQWQLTAIEGQKGTSVSVYAPW